MADKIDVENPNTPAKTTRVDAAKYTAMKTAMLAVVPSGPAGHTAARIKADVLPLLPDACFPQGPQPDGGSNACSLIWKPKA